MIIEPSIRTLHDVSIHYIEPIPPLNCIWEDGDIFTRGNDLRVGVTNTAEECANLVFGMYYTNGLQTAAGASWSPYGSCYAELGERFAIFPTPGYKACDFHGHVCDMGDLWCEWSQSCVEKPSDCDASLPYGGVDVPDSHSYIGCKWVEGNLRTLTHIETWVGLALSQSECKNMVLTRFPSASGALLHDSGNCYAETGEILETVLLPEYSTCVLEYPICTRDVIPCESIQNNGCKCVENLSSSQLGNYMCIALEIYPNYYPLTIPQVHSICTTKDLHIPHAVDSVSFLLSASTSLGVSPDFFIIHTP